MNKILLIITREYITRVRKKSFLVMTFLGPLLITGLYGLGIWMVINDIDTDEVKKVAVIDESHLFESKLKNSRSIEFLFIEENFDDAKGSLQSGSIDDYYGILHIPNINIDDPEGIKIYSNSQPSITIVNYIEKQLESIIEDGKLKVAGIDKDIIENIKTNINIGTIKLTASGEEESNAAAALGVGLFGALLIYFFIFLYGIQVMRSVLEEKTNRIVEIIISSVKPFQLMMGKIIGVAMVGLTQFLLWVCLVMLISTLINSAFMPDNVADPNMIGALSEQGSSQGKSIESFMNAINSINLGYMIGVFIFYFLGGYLLYSSLFAAVGAAVDNEADTQQFVFPITIPLVFAFIVAQSVLKNPDTSLAFWMSIIPFTSPVIMIARIPFGVPAQELILSMVCLVTGFLITTWLAGRIYRVGILMYGKKPSLKELGKWLFYKQ